MKRPLILIILLVLIIGLGASGYLYKIIWGPNVPATLDSEFLYIYPNTDYQSLSEELKNKGFIEDKTSFKWVSNLMKFSDSSIKSGKYKINASSSNRSLIQQLRSGIQTPVQLTFNNVRQVNELCGVIGKQLALDSSELLTYITSPENYDAWALNEATLMSLFIPNTYEVFWNCSIEQLMERMIKERNRFWSNDNRLSKLREMEMTKEEAYTLASIVQKETLKNDEKPTVAGVYINRINRGMPLQADPTVVFALKQFDLKRVLNKHLEFDSPYNTYINQGLPPGPICMPDQSSIDAVINYAKHSYLYFCAKPDYSGYHNFASNLIQHNKNANKYHRWLNQEKIR